MNSKELIELSQSLISKVKSKQEHVETLSSFERVSLEELKYLNSDKEKLVFWINTYNAFSLILKTKENPYLSNRISRKAFFSSRKISFRDIKFSLDDIEHKILRRNKIWWSFGYLTNPFPSKIFKSLSMKKLDPRIHFTLNCGALSCPPIRFYSVENLETELNIATKAFILGNSKVIHNQLQTSPIFKWFKADFSGRKGIIELRNQFLQKPIKQNIKINYLPYNWT